MVLPPVRRIIAVAAVVALAGSGCRGPAADLPAAAAPSAAAPAASAAATPVAAASVASAAAAPAADPGPAAGTLGGPVPGLDAAASAAYQAGRAAFLRVYGPSDGLGPHYNDVACVACHDQPTPGGGSDMGHAVRVVFAKPAIEGVWPLKALPGFATLTVPAGGIVSMHRPPALYGLGLLEAVPDEVVRANCDPRDGDGDGVRGHVNVGFDGRVGRFGYKAHNAQIRDFIANALSMEMGITNPNERDPVQKADKDGVADPEVPATTVDALTAYVRALAPPPRAGSHPAGEALFAAVGCTSCHKPDAGPGARGAYSDLCVHSLGPDFDNGMVDFEAKGDEWRTAPLWGLRLRKAYFHDDRAQSLEQAIGMHGGEAAGARDRFAALPPTDQRALLAFLATL